MLERREGGLWMGLGGGDVVVCERFKMQKTRI